MYLMNSDPRHIRISEYNYALPDDRIAKYPLAQRDHSKLLVYRKGEVTEDVFYNLPDYLPEGALMVFNNTKVIQARMHFRKETGALIEVFLLEPAAPTDYELMFQTIGHCAWYCLVGNLKKWKEGSLKREIEVRGTRITISATRGELHGTSHRIDFEWDGNISFAELIDMMGVAAPTAGLHFTPEVLAALDAHGIDREELTLHVGAGTFKPVKSEEIEGHEMHTEFISVRRETIGKLIAHHASAIAVGTTSVRTLESLYYMGLKVMRDPDLSESDLHVAQWEPYSIEGESAEVSLQALASWMDRHQLKVLHSSTQIIIAPGYDYKIVKMLVTNFHQPQSTLLLLVSAFVKGDWHRIYDYALNHNFRFLSYGDSSLLIP